MSRGPGRWQRALLDALAEHPAVAVTHPSLTHAEQVALRRAAYTLEHAGRLQLTAERVEGRTRLVAYRPEADMPEPFLIHGIDGKRYRRAF